MFRALWKKPEPDNESALVIDMQRTVYLWCPAPQHVKMLLQADGTVAGQGQRQRGEAEPAASSLQRPPLHAVCDDVVITHFHLTSYEIEAVAEQP